MKTYPVLWARLEALALDDPSAELPFSARLADANGWSRARALRVIGEYKRFVYLTQLDRGTVTPSDAVDRAWHLHLTYTRHYWDTLCRETLGRPLHHQPTRGGAAEDAKHAVCYRRALTLYAAEFDAPPPTEYWPEERIRFGEGATPVGTARRRANRPPRPLAGSFGIARQTVRLGLVALVVLLAGTSLALAAPFGGSTIGVVAIVLLAGVAILAAVTKRGRGRRRRGKEDSEGRGGGYSGCSGCGSGEAGGGGDGGGGGGGGCGGGGD